MLTFRIHRYVCRIAYNGDRKVIPSIRALFPGYCAEVIERSINLDKSKVISLHSPTVETLVDCDTLAYTELDLIFIDEIVATVAYVGLNCCNMTVYSIMHAVSSSYYGVLVDQPSSAHCDHFGALSLESKVQFADTLEN